MTCTASLQAQWSITANMAPGGTLTAASSAASQTIPLTAGPTAPGTIGTAATPFASASASWTPNSPSSSTPLNFVVTSSCATLPNGPGPSLATSSLTIDLLLTAPGAGPTNGVLALSVVDSIFGGATFRTIDVGADGTIEVGPNDSTRVLGATIPAGGLTLRIVVGGSTSGFGTIAQTDIFGCFEPAVAVVEPFDTFVTPVSLTAEPRGNDRWSLQTNSSLPSYSPTLMVFGFQPTNVVLAPGLTLLTTVDAVLPGGSLTFDLPPLPPGFELYVQGIASDSNGSLLSSNSLRATWF
ncbi:MAG: hypothetical protein AB8H80_10935 [Planctomycetota bacterium]